MSENYTTTTFNAQGTDLRPRDLPFLAGFSLESTAMLALVGIEDDGTLAQQALGGVLVNAVIGLREGCWTSYSRNDRHYSRLDRYSPLLRCQLTAQGVERAEALGLVDHVMGKNWRDGGKGDQSRFKASDRLCELLDGHPILHRGFVIRPTLREVLQLRHPTTNALLAYPETGRTRATRQEILDYNAQLARHRVEIRDDRVRRLDSGLLEIPTRDGEDTFLVRECVTYSRQFTASWNARGDLLWNLHGRCYNPHWQSCPKAVRKTMAIDGVDTGRLDYGNSHYRIACAEAGVDPGTEDAYAVRGYESESGRKLMKRATNIAINAADKTAAVHRIAFDLACADRRAETGSEIGARIGPEDMGKAVRAVEAVERRHPALSRIFYTGAGLRFMAIEADVMMGVVKAARRYDIPVLSIHDEAMMPADRQARVEIFMHDEWRKRIAVPALVRP